ncbi:uncharacterized protein METZ01_LOCUS327435, partial [marine metagenome]
MRTCCADLPIPCLAIFVTRNVLGVLDTLNAESALLHNTDRAHTHIR